MANCSGVPTGGAAALQCLQQNAANVSPGCRQALQAASGSSPVTAAASAPRPAAAAATTPVTAAWPHTFTGDHGTALVYQPQVISWPDRGTLNSRMAIAITPTGDKTPVLGTIQVAFDTQTNLDTRYVTLTNPKLVSTQFPTLDTNRAVQFANAITAGRRARRRAALRPHRRPPTDRRASRREAASSGSGRVVRAPSGSGSRIPRGASSSTRTAWRGPRATSGSSSSTSGATAAGTVPASASAAGASPAAAASPAASAGGSRPGAPCSYDRSAAAATSGFRSIAAAITAVL
jgi:hypothetical protein